MALTVVYSGTNDNEISSSDAVYATARSGSGSTLTLGNVNDNFLSFGQRDAGATYQCWESFLEWAYTLDSTQQMVSAYIQLTPLQNVGTAVRDLRIYENNWGGGTLTTGDWVPGVSVALGLTLGIVENIHSAPNGVPARAGGTVLQGRLGTTGAVRAVLVSSRFQAGTVPPGDEYNKVYSSAASGTAQDPALVYTTVRRNTMLGVSGCCAQLSDGTHVYVESNGATTPTLTLKYRTTAAVTATIATVPTGGGTGFAVDFLSLQKLALVVDASDNIYLVGKLDDATATSNALLAKAYQKTGSLTWSAKTALSDSLPAYTNSGQPNNFAAMWHPTSGAGHIMVIGSHIAWRGRTGATFYATLSCANLLAGSGSPIVASGADPSWFNLATVPDYVSYPNETGTMLDVSGVKGSNSGVIITADANGFTSSGTYTLNTSGVVSASGTAPANSIGIKKDANSKARVIVLPDGRYVASQGGRVVARSSGGSLLGFADMAGTATNYPDLSTVQGSSSWDMVYDPATQKVWLYYLDTTDSRQLRRTGFSLTSYAATGDSVVVNATVGATGSSNLSVRAPRGFVDERQVLVSVANLAADGTTLSTQYVADSFNVAPTAPVLGAIAVFDATAPKVVSWTFGDPNPLDTQASRQIQIIRTSDSASMLDTGQVATSAQTYTIAGGTLANGVAYQWRVRTWDPAGNAGPYSAYTDFNTGGGGTVTITDPATDNPGGQLTSDYSISWSVSGSTQASYRIVVIDTATGATFSDTGYITSTATTATIQNLASGREYRVQVTVRNAGLVVSNPGTRLITPVYSAPEVPILTLSQGPNYIQVSVTNPTPTGDKPEVTVNQLYRRRTGEVDFAYLGALPYNGTARDYEVAAGVSYDYYVSGVA